MNLRRVDRAGSPGNQAGVSLIELIFAVFLLGTATVTILGAFATLVKTSDLTRKTGDAGSTLAAVAEALADNQRNPYDTTCRLVPPDPSRGYAPGIYDPTAGVALPRTITSADVAITSVRYWTGTAFASDPDTAANRDRLCRDDVPVWRLQLIEVRIRTSDGKIDRKISVVKRG